MDNANAPTPTLQERSQPLFLRLRRHEWRIISLVISIKALLFLFAGQSYQVLQDQRVGGLRGWLEIWNRWDALNYQKIAQFGYSATGELKPLLVFYPLYPWTVRFFAFFTRDYLLSAFIVSTVASLIAAVVLLCVVRALPPREAWGSLALMGFIGVFVHQMLQSYALTMTPPSSVQLAAKTMPMKAESRMTSATAKIRAPIITPPIIGMNSHAKP